jgi:hypothetical protein
MHYDPSEICKRDCLGRVTVSAQQRESILDAFERSGLKGKPFAKLVGVNYGYWSISVGLNWRIWKISPSSMLELMRASEGQR